MNGRFFFGPLGAALLLVVCVAGAPAADRVERFTFAALGCMPYAPEYFGPFEQLIAEINRHQPAFTVHLGDTKSGGVPPTDEFMDKTHAWFQSFDGPLIYTPGDNEWTDVHRENNGRQDPLVWLGKVRAKFFAKEESFGRRPMKLVTQRRDPAYAKFVENARWTKGGVVFATVHVVGSNNNDQAEIPGALDEFRERDAANERWVRDAFKQARDSNAPGIALFFQANPFRYDYGERGRGGFKRLLDTIEQEAREYTKPVLLVHADEHRYRLDVGVAFDETTPPLRNVTRLETFGAGDIHGVLVVVDPESADVFLCGPLLVPKNAVPLLPKRVIAP